jgi:hypothetical protein
MVQGQEQEQERFVPEPPIYTFRARILGCMAGYAPENGTEIQREIEIAANSTLGDLGFAILDAYGFGSDHLWSFFLSGKAWDKTTEYAYSGGWGEDDDLEDVLDLFPEGSEMRKLVLLVNDPDFEPEGDFPAAIDRTKLQTEIVAMLREAALSAPEEDRALMEEFATLIAANPDADPTMLSEALGRYLAEDWEPGDASDVPDALLPGLPGGLDLDLAGFDLPGLDFPLFDEDDAPDVDEILIREVPYPGKTGKKEFLFLFDYGDEWHFGVKLLDAKGTLTPGAEYPRVVASRGNAPEQYPPWDEDDDEEWDDEEGDEDDTPRTGTILHFDPKTGMVTRETIDIPPKQNGT